MIVPVFDEIHLYIWREPFDIFEQILLVEANAGAGILGHQAKRHHTFNSVRLDLPNRFGDEWLPVAHPHIDRAAKELRQSLRLQSRQAQ